MTIWFSASCSLTILPNSVGLPALPLRMTSVVGSNKLTILPWAWVSPAKTRALVWRMTCCTSGNQPLHGQDARIVGRPSAHPKADTLSDDRARPNSGTAFLKTCLLRRKVGYAFSQTELRKSGPALPGMERRLHCQTLSKSSILDLRSLRPRGMSTEGRALASYIRAP